MHMAGVHIEAGEDAVTVVTRSCEALISLPFKSAAARVARRGHPGNCHGLAVATIVPKLDFASHQRDIGSNV